jgi:hypothetical protein
MSRVTVLSIAMPSLVVIIAAFWPLQIVTVSLPKEDNRLIATVRVEEDDMIILRYRHSVELTGVEGRFRIGPESEILAVETRMESVGTGMPNAFPERTKTEDGWLVVDEGQRPADPIRFFVVPINKPRLTIAGRFVDLTRLKAGTLIQISGQRTFLISWLLKI